jgi:hypothetical protein
VTAFFFVFIRILVQHELHLYKCVPSVIKVLGNDAE